MSTPTESGNDELAYHNALDRPPPAIDPDQRRKGWLAGLLLWRSATHHPLLSPFRRLRGQARQVRWRLGRKLATTLVGAALLFSFSHVPPAHAATITVDGARCTLVDAIHAANTDSVVGRCRAGSGADIITLKTDVTLTVAAGNYYSSPTGLPLVTSPITIQGNNHTISRDPNAPEQFRILAVGPTGDLTLNQVTVSGGQTPDQIFGMGGAVILSGGVLSLNDSTLSGNTANGSGGAVYSDGGELTLNNSTLSGNAAELSGGALALYAGTQVINNSTISGNSAEFQGGGIASFSGDLTINASTLSGNSALIGGAFSHYGISTPATINDSIISGNSVEFNGGGVAVGEFTRMTINNSTLSGNTARTGGGAYSYGWLSINNSTVSGNTADDGGGVAFQFSGAQEIRSSTISDNSALRGGGLFAYYAGAEISNSTISGNTAEAGGGIYTANYLDLTLVNSTISGNAATSTGGGVHTTGQSVEATFLRNLISDNMAPDGREIFNDTGLYSAVSVGAFNLFGFSGDAGLVGLTPGVTDIVPAGPPGSILAALANNGGPTSTHALVPGSPAIDGAPRVPCMVAPVNGLDQRGEPRNVDGDGIRSRSECDIGAFEFAP